MSDDTIPVIVSATGRTDARRGLARAVALLHVAIVVFFTGGWLLPWSSAHWLVIGGGALLPLSWALFNNDCPLTRLERRLAGYARDDPPEGQRYFVSRLLSRITGLTVSDRVGDIVIYGVLFFSMSICGVRLAF